MTNILTKIGIETDGFNVVQIKDIDPNGNPVTKWYIDVRYTVVTQEGENYNKNKQIELTGAKLTTAKNFFTTIKNQILSDEGVS